MSLPPSGYTLTSVWEQGKRTRVAPKSVPVIPPPVEKKEKIAVLGCGMGAIAALYELTQLPENRAKYDITVYQMGWRVGGKGASARNQQKGGRIEEHGLHIWFGFYDNSFKVMKDAYEELDRPSWMPLHNFETAFTPHDLVVLMDEFEGEWRTPWKYNFPVNSHEPGVGGDLPDFWTMAWFAMSWLGKGFETFLLNELDPCKSVNNKYHKNNAGGFFDRIKDAVGDVVDDVKEMFDGIVDIPEHLIFDYLTLGIGAKIGKAPDELMQVKTGNNRTG